MSSGGRVSIPGNVRKMIQNIKEITGNHSEEEIYAMLKECSMDPNETAQKLLLQDTFHEVKRKRDRKKEILNKEPAELRWKPGMQGRGNRGGRGNYSSRPTSHDAVGGKNNSVLGKENVTNHLEGGGTMPATSQDKKHAEATFVSSSSTAVADGEPVLPSESIIEPTGERAEVAVVVVVPPIEAKKPLVSSPSGVYFSASDPVLLPSQESRVQNAVGTIRREVGSHRTPPQRKSTTAVSTSNKSQGGGKNQLSESFQPAASTHTSLSVNYTSRSQQVIGPQKVAPSKEWKPKPTNPNLAQGSSGTVTSSQVLTVPTVEANNNAKSQSQPEELNATVVSKENTSEVEKKLEKSLHISESQSQQQHVVIPNHLHVPEAEKLGFCFGSFDASFGLNTISNTSAHEGDNTQQPLSESSEEESVEEQQLSSNQTALGTAEDQDCSPSSSSHVQENLSATEGHDDVSSNVVVPVEYNNSNEPKQEEANNMVPPGGGHQYSVVHTSPNYSFGFMPPMLGNQIAAPFETTPESQARGDVSRLPSFLVQQPFDPANYYAQFYRSGADSDGRVSPFHSPGVAAKFNGNVAVLSTHTPQVSQEGGNQLILSTAGPTPHVSQASGVMQSSIAVSQQPLPVFRQPPGGVHIPPHYAPNYIPYGHYISPFYVPPIHQFLSNGAFPQQAAAAGSVYPAGPPAVATKYSLSQYKPGSNNTGNSAHVGVAASYGGGPYGSSPAVGGYNASSGSNTGNSTSSNEELGGGSQFKESSNVYITGQQQNEGSGGVWIAGPTARDISSLQAASSFYNLPQAGGQFATGIYHHHPATPPPPPSVHHHTLLQQQSQPMVDITTGVYQQPSSAQQINWPNNY